MTGWGSNPWGGGDGYNGAPRIFNLSPATSVKLGPTTFIEFDLTDNVLITDIVIIVTYNVGAANESSDVIFAGGVFRDKYQLFSTVVSISDGYHFAVRHDARWPAKPKIEWAVQDGNLGVLV